MLVALHLLLCSILSYLIFHLIITEKLVGDVAIIFNHALFFNVLLLGIIKSSINSVSHQWNLFLHVLV
jgi:hypothetical protein